MYLKQIFSLALLIFISYQLAGSTVNPENPEFTFNVEYSQEGNIAKLAWSFDKNDNVAYYICEKSNDGVNFTNFSQVVSNHVSNLELDENLQGQLLYYRINIVLKSGETFTSEVKKLQLDKVQLEVNAMFYPNPVIESANIKILNYQDQSISFAVYSAAGEEVITLNDQKGTDHKLDFSGLLAGTYFIKAAIGEEVFIEKVDVID